MAVGEPGAQSQQITLPATGCWLLLQTRLVVVLRTDAAPASIVFVHFGHRDGCGLADLGEQVVWIDCCVIERACGWWWRSCRALRDPPALPICLQGLADESLLLLTQPSGLTHHLLFKCFYSSCLQTSVLNNTSKKLIPFCFTWPEDLCDLGGS